MRRNRQKEKTPDASGHMAAAPGVCCYLFVLVCEIEFLAVIVRIRHTFQLGKGLLGQRPHIPVHTRHGCGDLAYRPASVCVVVHTDQIFFFHGKPSKQTALAFAIALELSLDETKDMLMKAGFAPSHSSKADIVVEYCIMTGNYDIMEINQILFKLDLQPLGY